MDIFCFGAANVDISLRLREALVMGSSNPVQQRQSAGGVARNVAVTVARLGAKVGLCAPVGGDAAAEFLRRDLAGNGIDPQDLLSLTAGRSGTYTAVLQPDGELLAGFSDMSIYDQIAPEALTGTVKRASGAAYWFIDANWPADILLFLERHKPPATQVLADLVSVSKCVRLRAILPAIDFLFCNLEEALALSGCKNIQAAADHLLALGPGNCIITQGEAPCLLASFDPERRDFLAVTATAVRDVTGAGDALVGGSLFRLAQGRRPLEAVRFGLATAALTVASEATVPANLSLARVQARLGQEEVQT